MRTTFLPLLSLCMMLILYIGDAKAETQKSSGLNTREYSLTGEYSGALTRVHMNEDKSPIHHIKSQVTRGNKDTKVNIHISPFKVGAMPGTVSIEAKDIEVSEDGTFAQKCKNIVKIKMIGLPLKYDGTISGAFDGDTLRYTVTVKGQFAFKSFTSITTFEGRKQ
ncbi:calycin-like domain-containing protein [Porphyromonas sp.]|uniref:calycin-like domain-containing protein n=1 Tax=Porphyromonas sp. TaxID=1924944 RepID=UPI0026DC98B7|nr:calycin-like domain-containing protein [Porphyromonas sp.]MDO4770324.1 calycin-like domain-containing protein [Porphyromonas sp.]